MEIASDECLTEIRSLLSCRSNLNVVRGFKGGKAQEFVDFLDQVSESHARLSRANNYGSRSLHSHVSMMSSGEGV